MDATPLLEGLVQQLHGDDSDVQHEAARQIAQLGTAARAAAVPLARAAEADNEASPWVTSALERLGPPLSRDIPELVQLLAHSSDHVVSWSATLLGRLGDPAAESVPALCEAIDNRDDLHVKHQAVWAIGRMGTAAATATETLSRAKRFDNPRLTRLAERALRNIRHTV